jgi:hypothetical protein
MSSIIDSETYSKLLQKLEPRERAMFMGLACMSNVPEGVDLKYELVRTFYDWMRDTASAYLKPEQREPRRQPLTALNDINCRLRSNLMLVEALPPSEGEDKGELFRLYDQARRSLIEGVRRETSFIMKEAA